MAFIYGTKETPIAVDDFLVKCPSCETYSWAEVTVVCKYYHVYWVPFCPVSKEANITCKKCGLKRYGRAFDSDLISNYNEVKSKFKNPWYAYIGVAVVNGFVLSCILIALFR